MPGPQGFWSYVHADDQAEEGRISRLARDAAQQFKMLTGEHLELFLDQDAIKWGEDWKDRVDNTLASVAFFIPVITPRYFMSPECRREVQYFSRKATQLGLKELIMPLLYVDPPHFHEEEPDDDLVSLIRTFHWEDWRELRFADPLSSEYRRAVARLTARLVDANRNIEEAGIPTVAEEAAALTSEDADEGPGIIDRLATAEEALPRMTKTIEALNEQIGQISKIMHEGTADMETGGGREGFGGKIIVARNVARRLKDPADQIQSLGNEFTSKLHDVDEGFRIIISHAPDEIAEHPDSKKYFCQFFETVRGLSENAHKGLGSAQGMIDAALPLERMSRDLRPVMRHLRQGLTKFLEAREVTDEWLKLIEESGVDCG